MTKLVQDVVAAVFGLSGGIGRCLAQKSGKAGCDMMDAGMFRELSAQGRFNDEWLSKIHKLRALRRWGKPDHLGQVAKLFASSRASHATAQTISVSEGIGV